MLKGNQLKCYRFLWKNEDLKQNYLCVFNTWQCNVSLVEFVNFSHLNKLEITFSHLNKLEITKNN